MKAGVSQKAHCSSSENEKKFVSETERDSLLLLFQINVLFVLVVEGLHEDVFVHALHNREKSERNCDSDKSSQIDFKIRDLMTSWTGII